MDGLQSLFTEESTIGNMAQKEVSSMEALIRDRTELRRVALQVATSVAAPGQMSTDEAGDYMAKIANLFTGVDRGEVEVGLCIWGMLNGTGGLDDYAGKPSIEIGGKEVPATVVFGEILPVGRAGKPRQFFSTMFEHSVPRLLDALPELHDMMASRVAKAGLERGQTLAMIDFVKGVTSSTAGLGRTRQGAKDVLIYRRAARGGQPAVHVPEPTVVDLGAVSSASGSHNLF